MAAETPESERSGVDGEDDGQDEGQEESTAPALAELEETVLHPTGGRSASDYARIFDALGHPARLAALYTLRETGGCTYGDLSTALAAEDNGLNHHLRKVVETPLVRKTPAADDGRKMVYELTRTGNRITEYVLEMMAAEREAIEAEYADGSGAD